MSLAVLDASVVVTWFSPGRDRRTRRARKLRQDYENGSIAVAVPHLLYLEVLNVAARRWSWAETELHELASALEAQRFDVTNPDLMATATWAARGLTAYDAVYVALAEMLSAVLITDDQSILELAPELAVPLVDY